MTLGASAGSLCALMEPYAKAPSEGANANMAVCAAIRWAKKRPCPSVPPTSRQTGPIMVAHPFIAPRRTRRHTIESQNGRARPKA
eukprot:228796-Prymnesium_polylepis.1